MAADFRHVAVGKGNADAAVPRRDDQIDVFLRQRRFLQNFFQNEFGAVPALGSRADDGISLDFLFSVHYDGIRGSGTAVDSQYMNFSVQLFPLSLPFLYNLRGRQSLRCCDRLQKSLQACAYMSFALRRGVRLKFLNRNGKVSVQCGIFIRIIVAELDGMKNYSIQLIFVGFQIFFLSAEQSVIRMQGSCARSCEAYSFSSPAESSAVSRPARLPESADFPESPKAPES